jgi:hypothetical protein
MTGGSGNRAVRNTRRDPQGVEPSGVRFGIAFNPTSVTGSGNSTLTVSTGKKTPAGTYSLKITGTSSPLAHSTTVSLKVSNNGK